MMANCLFCEIIAGNQPAEPVWENEHFLAIKDVNPRAPLHLLIIPKKHLSQPVRRDLDPDQLQVLGGIFTAAHQIAKKVAVAESGYRLVNNIGRHAGQVISHFHMHFLAGRPLQFRP